MLFGFLRWVERNRQGLRWLDYVLAGGCLAWGLWQMDWLSIVLGAVFLLAAALNLNERLNWLLPRIQKGKNKPDV